MAEGRALEAREAALARQAAGVEAALGRLEAVILRRAAGLEAAPLSPIGVGRELRDVRAVGASPAR